MDAPWSFRCYRDARDRNEIHLWLRTLDRKALNWRQSGEVIRPTHRKVLETLDTLDSLPHFREHGQDSGGAPENENPGAWPGLSCSDPAANHTGVPGGGGSARGFRT